jgi:hypothetical protein
VRRGESCEAGKKEEIYVRAKEEGNEWKGGLVATAQIRENETTTIRRGVKRKKGADYEQYEGKEGEGECLCTGGKEWDKEEGKGNAGGCERRSVGEGRSRVRCEGGGERRRARSEVEMEGRREV